MDYIKRHKERFALAGLGITFVVFIGGGMYLQKNNHQEKELQPKDAPVRMEVPADQQERGQKEVKSAAPATAGYHLKPSPDELLQQLASMEKLKAEVVDEKMSQLPVLWPAYFFTIQESEAGQKSLVLDVSENGFGVVIESAIDIGLYPQLQKLKAGQKVWLGGKILAVDPAGTGRIYLKTEQFRIGDEDPFLQVASPEKP
jgi:tartrate dehydratase beta subunit/fumarate hydratase class I family protein